MKSPATCDESATLKNGQQVRIRAIRPTDKGLVLEMFRSLESESIDTRFFHAKKVWTGDNRRSITETVFAFAVTIELEGDEVMIGGGGYTCLETPCRHAKVAFTVEGDYQGQGMAGLLIRLLTANARGQRPA